MQSVKKILLTLFLFFLFPSNIFAEEQSPTPNPTNSPTPSPTNNPQNYDNVFLSEIYPNANDGEKEWIEIQNPDGRNLSGLIVRDKTEDYQILGSITSTFIIIETTIKLNNSTDKVFLTKPDGTNIDEYEYLSSEKNKSWSKVNGSWCKTNPTKNSSNSSCIVDPTPTPTPTPTSTPVPTSTPTSQQNVTEIRINEVYPCPKDDGNEWIEIYNNHDFEINLNNWYLKDSADNTRKISDLTIAGKSFIYFAFGSGFLNNDGDTIKLFDSNNELKFSLTESYPLISEDMSWAYVGSSWCIAESTKGSPNTKCFDDEENPEENEKEETDKTTAKNKEDEDSKNMFLAKERDMPDLEKNENEATVAGVTTTNESSQSAKPNLTIPIIIAGAGFLILSGASYPFLKPKLAPFFAKLRKKK